jgi:hypothetical protein
MGAKVLEFESLCFRPFDSKLTKQHSDLPKN